MTIRYAGIDLLLEDPEGAVRSWLDQHLSELFASIFCLDNTAIREARFASLRNIGLPSSEFGASSGFPLPDTPTVRRVGLPVGNYPRPPRPRINSLYWPTGATRWAHGLFLISKSNLDTVLAACEGEQSQTFELSSPAESSTGSSASSGSSSTGITASLFALAPRPVSAPGVAASDRLWILPLVDARYFWQFYHVERYAPATWAEALSLIQGVSSTDTPALSEAVPSAYGRPSSIEFVRDFENAAVLADAVALTIGRRVVGGPEVSAYKFQPYQTQTADTAWTIADDNLASGWDAVAGGEFTSQAETLGNVPSRVVVTYGQSDGDRTAGFAEYEKPSGATHGGSKVFHCSAAGSSSVPADGKYTSGFEQNLVNRLSADYYQWLTLHYDITYAGIVPWQITGFDDYLRWEVAVHGKGRRRRYQCQTRAVSMPPNFGYESLPIDPLGSSSSSSLSSSSSSASSSSESSSSGSSPSSSSPSSVSSASSSLSSTSSFSSESSASSGSASSQSSGSSASSTQSGSSEASSGSHESSGSSQTSSGSSLSGSSAASSSSSSGSSSSSSSTSSASSSSGSSSASSGSSSPSGSSGSDCIEVVTDVTCNEGGLSVTKVTAKLTLC